jgi:hypothetical protein
MITAKVRSGIYVAQASFPAGEDRYRNGATDLFWPKPRRDTAVVIDVNPSGPG